MKPPIIFSDDAYAMFGSMTSEIDELESIREALHGKHSQHWKEAMISEYSSLQDNQTWKLVPPTGSEILVSSRWIFKVKSNENGAIDRFKARVVAQGYSQNKRTDYDEVFSP